MNSGKMDEEAFIKRYMELTGTSEVCARSVYMYLFPGESNRVIGPRDPLAPQQWTDAEAEPARASGQSIRRKSKAAIPVPGLAKAIPAGAPS